MFIFNYILIEKMYYILIKINTYLFDLKFTLNFDNFVVLLTFLFFFFFFFFTKYNYKIPVV